MTNIITIDGPASSGKTSIAKILANILNVNYLLTGNIYRSIAASILQSGIEIYDSEAVSNFIESHEYVTFDDKTLSDSRVGNASSIISTYPQVRKFANNIQFEFIKNNEGGIVEGRDIGSIICPDAKLKIFLTASPEERAKRRYNQIKDENPVITYQQVLEDIIERDNRDKSREISPMIVPQDAIIIDSTNLTPHQVVELITKSL